MHSNATTIVAALLNKFSKCSFVIPVFIHDINKHNNNIKEKNADTNHCCANWSKQKKEIAGNRLPANNNIRSNRINLT